MCVHAGVGGFVFSGRGVGGGGGVGTPAVL